MRANLEFIQHTLRSGYHEYCGSIETQLIPLKFWERKNEIKKGREMKGEG